MSTPTPPAPPPADQADHLQACIDGPGPSQTKSGKELSRLLALLDSLECDQPRDDRRGKTR